MKAQFEEEDIQAIAAKVAEMLRSHFVNNKANEDDVIFGVKELAAYLKVKVSWIYKQVQQKTIPYFKPGKYNLFRKAEIDKWISAQTIKPVPQLSLLKKVR